MAFTKAPMNDSRKVTRIDPPLQPIVTTGTTTAVTAVYVDCFPMKEEQWVGEPQIAVHKRQAWTSYLGSTGDTVTGTSQGYSIAIATNESYKNYVYYAYGNDIFYINTSTGANTKISTVNGSYYLGTFTNAINSANTRKIACLGGLGAQAYLTLCDEDGTNVTNTDLVALLVTGVKGLVFIDGYLFAVNSVGNKIYNSGAGGALTTWASTDFLDAEQYADPILYIEKHHNYLVAFGSSSIEFFYNNAVEIGSPLARQESYSAQVGLVNQYGPLFTSLSSQIAKHGDDIYFVGCSPTVSATLYRIRNFKVEPVQTPTFIQELMASRSIGIALVHSNWINNNPVVVVEFLNSGGTWAYMINEDAWFKINAADYPNTSSSIIGIPFISRNQYSTPLAIVKSSSRGQLKVQTNSDSLSASIQTTIQDFGVNRFKSLHRVDVLGDFGSNAVSLTLGKSMNYANGGTVSIGTQTQSTIGYQSNLSFYNLGAYRQFFFSTTINGTGAAVYRGLEVEYDVGAY